MNLTTCCLRLLRWALAAAALQGPAVAQPTKGPDQPRTWVTLQAVAAHWSMQTRGDGFLYDPTRDGSAGAGTSISTEGDLGLPRRKPLPGLVFGRRIGEHWRIEVEHTAAKRSGSAVLRRDLMVDGLQYAAGSTLVSELGLSTLSVLGGWSATVGDGTEAGLLVGGQWVRLLRRLRSPGTPDAYAAESENTAPQPLLGVFVQHRLAPQWRLDGRLTVSTAGNYQATAGVQWQAQRHLALTAGYRVTRHHLDVESFVLIGFPDRLVLNATLHGPLLSASVAF